MDSVQSVSESKVKIFECKQCNVPPFTQKSHLNSHMKLKHSEESGKRECVRCTSAYSQMNNFVVHYKKEHLKKECGQCNGKNLCTLCDLDLKSAKVEWQLKPLEVKSPEFESVRNHICEVCKMPFREKFQLNAHIKLKHNDTTSSGLCTKCPATFAQMNNFVVHYKKNHLDKDCVCNGGQLCDECVQNVVQAKKLWSDNKAKQMNDPKPPKIAKPATPATIVQASSIAAPASVPFAATTLSTADSLAIKNTHLLAAVPALAEEPITNEILRRKIVAQCENQNQACGSIAQNHSINDCPPNTKKTTVTSNATVCCSSNKLDSSDVVAVASSLVEDTKHKATPPNALSGQSKPCRNIVTKSRSVARMKTIATTAIALVDDTKPKGIPSNVSCTQTEPRRISEASSNSSSQMETLAATASALVEKIVEKPSFTATTPFITGSVYDKILEKVTSTQSFSELAHITKQAENKHLIRANVDCVLHEAAKSSLDIGFLKKARDVEKYWILATYLRRNPDNEYSVICEKVGADVKRLETFLSYNISCEEAMGMFPGAYIRLKNEYKCKGANTELNKELIEFSKARPGFDDILDQWKLMQKNPAYFDLSLKDSNLPKKL